MNTGHGWNDTDGGKMKYLDKQILSQRHFFHYKSHINWPGIESEPPRWEAGDWAMERPSEFIVQAEKVTTLKGQM